MEGYVWLRQKNVAAVVVKRRLGASNKRDRRNAAAVPSSFLCKDRYNPKNKIMLKAENITKKYAEHTALDNVSLHVAKGKVFGLLGPNGAGKTTLIRIINRITVPDSGSVIFDGHPFTSDDVRHIGYLPEERGLYKKMQVGEQAMYLARLKGMSKSDARRELTMWFEKFDIMPWWNKKLEELSKGMQQKVQFVTTVVHRPQLMIFDEPFSGFDPVNAELLKREILELRDKGHTIIYSTHNMASVEDVCDDIALINKSRVVLSGSVTEVKRRFADGRYEIRAEGSREQVEQLASQLENARVSEILPSMNDVFLKIVK